jgi:glycosyltransferase involved in cell wall biosynthesis
VPSGYDITLLSTADWDNPFWTNKQHVAVELARRGHRVLYVESLGLRRPSASMQDLRRVLRRAFKALQFPRAVRPGIWVWSPLVIPLQRYAAIRWINRRLLAAGLSFWSRVLRFRPQLLWTYNPMTLQLLPTQRFQILVYHCVDEISAQPGMPSHEIERAETELLRAAHLCFVTAEGLLEPRRAINAETYYFPNVADYGHFARARDPLTAIPADVAALPSPRLGFIGAISGYKLDFDLLRTVAERQPGWSIILIGKVGEGDPWTDLAALRGLRNIHLLGPRAYGVLPAYLKGFDVAILPSARNEYTAGMFPMKFFEYLAAGCPVVSTDLPALRTYASLASLAGDAEQFIEGVRGALAGRCASLDERLGAAQSQTYEHRTERMLSLIARLAPDPRRQA